MKTDIEIAQSAHLEPILALAKRQYGIEHYHLEPYGHTKAKLALAHIESLKNRPNGKLILVTAISPTPAGEGKTTTTIGLGDALNRIGKKAIVCLREPSMGPVFGAKGGAAGGGYAQVVPMEDINLHFTGDFHAIAAAHNLLAALLDNHLHQGNALGIDSRRIMFNRVVDMNDRALRKIIVGLGGATNGVAREGSYDIVVASEVMAIVCLAGSFADLKERLGNIIVAYTHSKQPVYARDLQANGAMAAILKDAILPNVVQTLENNMALIHGGPFASIAHGCNSVLATKAALKLADYCVTEAGFGADLGAEKFIDIKCRLSGLKPDAAVLVTTIRALKYHGDFENLKRHVHNIRTHYGLPCVVALNHFAGDTEDEIQSLSDMLALLHTQLIVCKHWAEGSAGAEALAQAVVAAAEHSEPMQRFVYATEDGLTEKIYAIAHKIYGAAHVTYADGVMKQLREWDALYRHFPICIAKTPMSFSTDPALKGAPSGHTVHVREVRLNHGAGFIVAICGDIMTMPGLPKVPNAHRIDIDEAGRIVGLS